jgi:hypothetical protein
MQSLLGQFYTRIKGSQEDIASEGLVYILNRSKAARDVIGRIIKSDLGLDLPDLTYVSQNTGIKLERPDVTGCDDNGQERVIFEAKFWASLTDNQPVEYLNRLKENSALIFVCPTLRVRPIFDAVLSRLRSASYNFIDKPEKHILNLEHNRYIIIKTWDEILGGIKLALSQDNNPSLLSDIDQIIGFCNTIDNEAFLPISSDDLSPKYARRINSYYDLIDKVTDELKKRKIADTVGLKATGQKYGYTRYFSVRNYGLALNVKFESWARDADTPFWVSIKEKTGKGNPWLTSDKLRRVFRDIVSQFNYKKITNNWGDDLFALFPLLDKTEDLVVDDMADQITFLLEETDKRMISE